MTDLYSLPQQAVLEGVTYDLNTDFRVILKIFRVFGDETLPPMLRWLTALRLFYRQEIPLSHRQAAMEYLGDFLRCGGEDSPGEPLFSWEKDAAPIIAGVNAAAGREVRMEENVHWWTFLGWFHAMPTGMFSALISIRQKLRAKQKLEPHEEEFYRENKSLVDWKPSGDDPEKLRLNALLGE